MEALALVRSWPVDHVAAGVVTASATATSGDVDRVFHLASLTKVFTAWAVLVAVEEGVLDLDAPLTTGPAPAGVTVRHLLAHAAGFAFDGDAVVAGVARRRVYSNTGIERAAAELAGASGIDFGEYLVEAVLAPLGMTSTELRGSPAHGMWSTVTDMVRFVAEMRSPRLIARTTWNDAVRPQFPDLAGIVPGVGRFVPCPWGLGVEIRGDKSPHWTGRANSPATFGHFGGSGTMMWVDPVADVGVVALTDRRFDDWHTEALALWPAFSDAVITETGEGDAR